MSERRETRVWWLVSVLAAFVVGWFLAVRTLALRFGTRTGLLVPADASASGGGEAVPPTPAEMKKLPKKVRLEERAEDYLTVKELEDYWPLCGKSIRREIAEGKLPSLRMRGKVTVKGSDALAWLSARREGGNSAENA